MNWREMNDAVVAFVTGHAVLGRLLLTSVEFAVLALAVGALIFVLRLRQPRLRALLWLMVLAKPLVGLALGTPLPLFLLTPPALPEVSVVAEPVAVVSRPLNLTHITRQTAASAAEMALPETAPVDYGALALKGALGLWLTGCAVMALRLALGQWKLRRLIRAAVAPPAWLEGRLAEAARALKLTDSRLPHLRVTAELESPALAGFWRPVILVPAWLCGEADPRQVDWALRHELMHWRLRDPLASLLRELARIFFFFHPAAWWAGRKWQEATEMACDRALIHSMEDAEMYVQELYRMLLKVRAQRRVPVAGGLFAGRTQISQRIASLAQDPLRAPARLSAAMMGLVVLLSVASLSVGVGVKSQAADGPEVSAGSASLPGLVLGGKAGMTTSTLRVKTTADKLRARGESDLELEGAARYGLDFGSFAAVVAADRIKVSPNVKSGWIEIEIEKIPPETREAKLVELARAAIKKGAVESVWSSADQVTVIPAQKECRLEGNAILVQKITPDKLRVYRSGLIFLNEEAPGRPRVAISGKGSATGIATTEIDLESNVSASSAARQTVSDADKLAAEDLAATGWRLWQQRKLAEAEAAFKKALEKDPTNANTWNGLGWAQQNQGKVLNAKKAFEEALKRDPKQAASLNGLGWIAKGEGKTDEAIGYWKRAVEALPEATAALAGLATTYMEQKNYQEAQKVYEQWLKAEPNSPEAKAGLEKTRAGLKGTPAEPPIKYENLKVTPLDPANPAKGVRVIFGGSGTEFLAKKVVLQDSAKKRMELEGVTFKKNALVTVDASRIILEEIDGKMVITLNGDAKLIQHGIDQTSNPKDTIMTIKAGATIKLETDMSTTTTGRLNAEPAEPTTFSEANLKAWLARLNAPDRPPFEALNVIIKMGPEAVPGLIEAMKTNNNWQVPKALGAVGDKRATLPLIEKLEKNQWSPMKEVVAEALENITGQKLGTDAKAWRKWWASRQ